MRDIRPPLVDFSQLGGIVDAYHEGQNQRRQRDILDARKDPNTVVTGPDGQVDWQATSGNLLRLGDFEGGLGAARVSSQMTPKQTSGMQEYELAKQQGFQGSFFDYQKALRQSGADNITVGGGKYGTIPQGYQLFEGPDGGASMRPIPGGPAAVEAEEAEKQAQMQRQAIERTGDIVLDDIDRSLNMIGTSQFPTTGLGGALTESVPGTPSHDLSQLLTTVKANIGFDKLQAMRAASPTGGALGQVSEFENRLLQATFGALAQSQGKEQLQYNLKRVRDTYLDIVHGPGNRPEAPAEGATGLPEGVTEEDVSHTMQKHNMTREQVLERLKK